MDRVLPRVEPGRSQILGPVERELPVPPQVPGPFRQRFDVALDPGRQALPLREQYLRDVVHPGRVDAAEAQQSLQGKLDDLLRLADHVRPAFPLEQHLQGRKPDLRPPEIVAGQPRVSHQPDRTQ